MTTNVYPQAAVEFSFLDYLGTLVEDEEGWMDPLLLDAEQQSGTSEDETNSSSKQTAEPETEPAPVTEVSS